MNDNEFVVSTLSQKLEIDGHAVKVEIYSSGKNDWILEIVDDGGNSTVWDSTFETDEAAFDEFKRAVEEEGIDSLLGLPD